MTFWTSVLWKMNKKMVKKWPEMVEKRQLVWAGRLLLDNDPLISCLDALWLLTLWYFWPFGNACLLSPTNEFWVSHYLGRTVNLKRTLSHCGQYVREHPWMMITQRTQMREKRSQRSWLLKNWPVVTKLQFSALHRLVYLDK